MFAGFLVQGVLRGKWEDGRWDCGMSIAIV